MTFARTQDYAFIREVLTNPSVYDKVTDDSSPSREEFQVPEDPRVWWIAADQGGARLGLLATAPLNAATWDIHIAVLPFAWGLGPEIAREGVRWIWDNTPAKRLTANVPIYNKVAKSAALYAGFKQFGVNEKSFMKRGKLYDQFALGISKE